MLNVPYRQHRSHLSPVPLLPIKGNLAPWGPFAKRGARGGALVRGAPAPAVVACACCALALFLVAVVSVNGLSSASPRASTPFHGDGSSVTDLSGGGGGGGGRRHLTQWLAPIWYALPTLRDALYNLARTGGGALTFTHTRTHSPFVKVQKAPLTKPHTHAPHAHSRRLPLGFSFHPSRAVAPRPSEKGERLSLGAGFPTTRARR
jgi:hypothetical protein